MDYFWQTQLYCIRFPKDGGGRCCTFLCLYKKASMRGAPGCVAAAAAPSQEPFADRERECQSSFDSHKSCADKPLRMSLFHLPQLCPCGSSR